MATARYRSFDTPVGTFVLVADGRRLMAGWRSLGEVVPSGAVADEALEPELSRRLSRYFAGERVRFEDVPVPAGSRFAERCWSACRAIPRGCTLTYGQLAAQAGSSGAARAAGQAMRRNPLPVIVPCHRVVASGGGLHGYAGGRDPAGPEIAIKRWLLNLEEAATS